VARVEIEAPRSFPFETEIPIRISDVNYGGHLGNDAVLSIAHEARVRFLASLGFSELDVDGVGILMVDAAVVYRAEGRHGQTLRVRVGAADVRSRGLDLVYVMTDSATGQEIARAKTGIVFFDYGARRVVATPPRFREAIAAGRS
jgi:4-hydroxybenzoyl-CoA thioesterase